MDQATRNKIVSFIWGNAHDVPRGRKSRGSHSPLRTLAKSNADMLVIEKADKGLSDSLLVGGTPA